MNISLSWLREYVTIDLPPAELADYLISTGLKVEAVHTRGVAVEKVVVARILESAPHPDADRLSVCQVNDGSDTPRQIVCGAKNYRVGDKVPLALPGAVLPGDFKIKVGKLRGVKSEGMMCSGRELGLSEDAAGLLILSTEAPEGTPIGDLFPAETVFELEITPNRPDWLGHIGVARELSAFLRTPLRLPEPGTEAVAREDASLARIDDACACPFYSVRRLRGLRVGPSPDWLRQRLETIGLRPINNVVDVTNYVLHEWGQPLHAFDAAKLRGGLHVRSARDGESFTALDGSQITLQNGETVIADEAGPVALAGIMGGLESGVTETTTEVWLESAYFSPAGIRRTGRRTGLSSDSSYRFERGVDPQGILPASARAVALLLEVAGGEVEGEVWTAGASAGPRPAVFLRPSRCRTLLGVEVSDEEIREGLGHLGLELVGETAGSMEWRPPGFRIDLEREIDLVEEVARLVGIDRIPARMQATVVPQSVADVASDGASELRDKLIGRGFFEARCSTLIAPQALASLGWPEDHVMRLKNPLGEDQSRLRPSLLPGLLQALQNNLRHGQSTVRLFEIGKIYSTQGQEERPALGFLATGPLRAADWRTPPVASADFAWLRGLVEELFPGRLTVEAADAPGCVLGARIFSGAESVGWLGILSPALTRDLGACGEIVVGEIHWESLVTNSANLANSMHSTAGSGGGVVYRSIPKFPATTRDLAVVLPADLPYARVAETLAAAREPLLVDYRPFDVFRDASGEKLAGDKKSLAVSLTFQSPEKTLETGEIEKAMERLRSILQEKLGAEFRS